MDFQTPRWCCRIMADMVPEESLDVLEPTPGEGNLVDAISLKRNVTAPADFWAMPDGRWDCIVMNPPFSPMEQGYRILYRCMGMTDHIVALMPWLSLINSERRTADIRNWGLVSVTHLPRKTFKGSRVQCCILEMHRGHSSGTFLRFASHPG